MKLAPALIKKNFQDLCKQPRKLRTPDPLTYPSWTRVQPNIVDKLRDFIPDDERLENEVRRLFGIGSRARAEFIGPMEERFADGYIDFDGLKAIADRFDPFLLDSEVHALFRDADSDRDGKLSLNDLRDAIRYNVRHKSEEPKSPQRAVTIKKKDNLSEDDDLSAFDCSQLLHDEGWLPALAECVAYSFLLPSFSFVSKPFDAFLW